MRNASERGASKYMSDVNIYKVGRAFCLFATMKRLLLCTMLIMSVLLAGCGFKPASEKLPTVMCTFNDDPVMEQEVRDRYLKLAQAEIQNKYEARCEARLKGTGSKTKQVEAIIDEIKDIQATGYDLQGDATGAFE